MVRQQFGNPILQCSLGVENSSGLKINDDASFVVHIRQSFPVTTTAIHLLAGHVRCGRTLSVIKAHLSEKLRKSLEM